MGNLIWHEYARYVSLTATVYTIWASFWGFFFRKFFWDFVGGTLRDPGGLQAPASSAIFVTIIVKFPIIQIVTMLTAFFMIALEFPLPKLKGTAIHRSIVLRIVLLIMQAVLAIMFYQGTNGALWSLIAAGCYTRAQVLGEKMEEAKNNKGTSGLA
jgi:hypothetical protein